MLVGIFFLLLGQLCGEVIVQTLNLPVPGPVIGIALVLAGQYLAGCVRGSRSGDDHTPIEKAADGLLQNLGLVFVPAGVGILQNYQLIVSNGFALLCAIVVSTLLTLLVTVGVFRMVTKWVSAKGGPVR